MGKKDYGSFIFGAIFIFIGIALLVVSLSNWSQFLKAVDTPWFLLGGEILFVVGGIAIIIFTAIKNKIIDEYNTAKKNLEPEEVLFAIENKYKKFRQTTVSIMCTPIPFILFIALLYILTIALKQDDTSIFEIIIIIFCLAFLAFIGIGLIISLIQNLIKTKDDAIYINGELNKIILANETTTQNNNVVTNYYRLLVTYKLNDKKCEMLSHETYSEEQIKFIKKLIYIPLKINGNFVQINEKRLLTTAKEHKKTEDSKLKKGYVAMISDSRANQTSATQNLHKITEDADKINQRIKKTHPITTIFLILFFIIFNVPTIIALTIQPDTGTIFYALICFSFTAFVLYRIIIHPNLRKKLHDKIKENGTPAFAEDFKLVRNSSSEESGYRYTYSLVFTYLDSTGTKRKARETNIKVSHLFFSSYDVKKLPILVWNKRAQIDYDELLKYQTKQDK